MVKRKTMQDLSILVQQLITAQVECVLVGGYAAIVHGVSLVTQDVDFCCRFSEENLLRLQSAVADLHPVHRLTPQKLPLNLAPGQCGNLKNLYLRTDLGILDCISEVLGIGGYDQVFQDSQPLQLSNGVCQVLNIDSLIRAKEAMNRRHDRITADLLRAIKERSQKN